jgi:hypothetical protein
MASNGDPLEAGLAGRPALSLKLSAALAFLGPTLLFNLRHDDLRMNHGRALVFCFRMIFSESRCTLFRIMR